MIIVRLIGGLGNQLFQYAVGRDLALKHGVPLKLDISGFETYKLHKYSLGSYTLAATIASSEDRALFVNENGEVLTDLEKLNRTFIQEISPVFNPRVLEAGRDTYLAGYWNSEKYFIDIRKTILSDLTVDTPPEGENAKILEKINASNSVSLHVRRGDYVNNRVFGVCGLDYYKKAIDHIAKKVNSPTFFVFSDDYEWVKDNLKIDYPAVYVHHNNADKNYEDLRLMSACKHNIIANSTFSWWGAWLNQNEDKVVIAPKKWHMLIRRQPDTLMGKIKEQIKRTVFKLSSLRQKWFGVDSYNTKDLIPKSWIKM
jgi:hypothetical protein